MRGRIYPRPSAVEEVDGKRKRVAVKGSTWTYEFAVIGADRKRRIVSAGGFRTRKAAQGALNDTLAEQGRNPKAEPIRVNKINMAELVENEWMPLLSNTLKASTVAHYSRIWNLYLLDRLGGDRVIDLTPGRIAATYADLRRRGGKPGKDGKDKPLSEVTVRHAHVLLGRVLGHAVALRIIRVSPLAELPADVRPRTAQRDPDKLRHWSPEQARAFLASTADHRLHGLFVVLLNLGLRRGEAAGLQWGDIDLEAPTLSVRRNRVVVNHEVVEGIPKTRRASRTIELDPALVLALKAHKRRQLEDRVKWGEAWQGAAGSGLYVFTREDGTPLHPDFLASVVERATAKAGLPDIGVHGLRHTSATAALVAGVPLKVVSERLGHSSTSFTADQYQHVVAGQQADASARLSAIFGEQ